MTPNFALNLSEDGIALLHRAAHGAGWVEVGRVALDDPDLGGALKALRDKAAGIEGAGFATKLILPPSQLLYATVAVDGDVTAQVEQALEERTPYTADQLSYDVSGDPPQVKVVAVARETLDEAEGFIGPYGFNPQGFTAIPDPDHFDGEPHLSGAFNTDVEPVRIISKAQAEAASAEAEAAAEAAREAAEQKALADAEAEAERAAAQAEADALDAAEAAEQAEAEAQLPEPQPEQTPDPSPADLPPTPPAAFSSRRKPSLGPATDAGDIVTSRAPRIAIPTDERRANPKSKKPPKVEPRIKTGEAAKPKAPPPLVPPAAATQPVEPAPQAASDTKGLLGTVAALRAKMPAQREKPAPEAPQIPDPIAELAAKQSAGKPRFLGLILTGILILALMLFAALSSYLLPEETLSRLLGTSDDAAPTEVVETDVAPVIDTTGLSDAQPDETDFPAFTIPSPEEIAEAETPEPEIVPLPEMTANEAQTAYAVSGIWQMAPDLRVALDDETLDALYDSSLDPALAFEDAPALASFDAAAQALSFQQPDSPAPALVMLNLDSRGLVRPTPDGALNPGGVLVFSGPPPIAAVPRPDGLAPVQPEADSAEVETPDATTDPDAPFADPALAGFKPRQRPADLQERFERATQNGLSTSDLAAIRPLPRPDDAAQASIRAREEAIAAALAEAAAEEALREQQAEAEAQAAAEAEALAAREAEELDNTGTRLAVARSARPDARPRNFNRVVARAQQRARPAETATASASTASAARATGPAVTRSSRARPTGPVSATVARAATDNNALALGKVALVGVFGTASNRRALVRMPNGRFKKVSVGDRVDGGRVAAIGEGQLKYTKGSRTLTLQMPKG